MGNPYPRYPIYLAFRLRIAYGPITVGGSVYSGCWDKGGSELEKESVRKNGSLQTDNRQVKEGGKGKILDTPVTQLKELPTTYEAEDWGSL